MAAVNRADKTGVHVGGPRPLAINLRNQEGQHSDNRWSVLQFVHHLGRCFSDLKVHLSPLGILLTIWEAQDGA